MQQALPAKLACPNCGKDDMVQKVSAVVGSGTAATIHAGTPNVLGANQTLLSNRLLPLPRPKLSLDGTNGAAFATIVVFTIGAFTTLYGIASFNSYYNYYSQKKL